MPKMYKVTFGIDFGESYSSASFIKVASDNPDQAHEEFVEFVYAHLSIDTEVLELPEAIKIEKNKATKLEKGGE